jgi:hypothetical protein
MITQKEIKIKKLYSKTKRIYFEDIIVLGDKVYILGSAYLKKVKQLKLIAFPINEDGSVDVKGQKELHSFSAEKRRYRGNYYFRKSPSKDKLLILHATKISKKDLIKYSVRLIDKDLNTITVQEETIHYGDRKRMHFSIADYDVSIDNDIFVVINQSYRDKKAKKHVEKFFLHSYKVKNDYKKEVLNIDVKKKSIMNCELLATSKGIVHLAGLYSGIKRKGKAKWKLEGAYAASININENKLNNIAFTPFDYKTKVKLIGKRKAKKNKDVNPNYFTHSLIEKEDGGIILLSELSIIVYGKSQGFGPIAMTPVTYINDQIIVTSFNSDGTVKWTNVVPKKQVAAYTILSLNIFGVAGGGSVVAGASLALGTLGKGPEYLSVLPIYKDGTLTVMYNDHVKNNGKTDMDHLKRMRNYNKSVLVLLSFDENGKISRLNQTKINKEQLILRPRVFHRLNDRNYIIYSSKKKKDKLGYLKLN